MSDFDSEAGQSAGANPPAPEQTPADAADIVTFLDDGALDAMPAAESTFDPADTQSGPPGPGLLESCGWTAAVLGMQIFASFAVLLVGVIILVLPTMLANNGRMPGKPPELTDLGPNLFALASGLPAFLAYLVLIPLACWRISPEPLRKLNFSSPSLTQALIVCSCVLPLGFVSDGLYTLVQPVWDRFLEQIGLQGLKDMGLAETMKQLNGASLPLLLFFLSVVPAVGEEWMLRGLIGRGLVARWGVVPGVVMTSLLFAAMHIDPPHVAAVLPIGVIMHFVYLTTRSFWMPILYHFLNNATVSVFTSLGTAEPGEAAAADGATWLEQWGPLIIAVPYLALALTVLWKLRTRYVAADGSEVRRNYFTFEHLPEGEAQRVAPNHVVAALVFGTLLALQAGKLGADVWSTLQEQPAPIEDIELQPALGGVHANLIH